MMMAFFVWNYKLISQSQQWYVLDTYLPATVPAMNSVGKANLFFFLSSWSIRKGAWM